jgi:hypothetical protein
MNLIHAFLLDLQMDTNVEPTSIQERSSVVARAEPGYDLDYVYSTSPGYDLDSGYSEWDDEYGPHTEYYTTAGKWLNFAAAVGIGLSSRIPTVPNFKRLEEFMPEDYSEV